jgi:hypothetical protein
MKWLRVATAPSVSQSHDLLIVEKWNYNTAKQVPADTENKNLRWSSLLLELNLLARVRFDLFGQWLGFGSLSCIGYFSKRE